MGIRAGLVNARRGLGYVLIIAVFAIKTALPQDHREVSAVIGNAAILPCTVDFLGTQHVIWRDPRSAMLTINEQVIVDDSRISVLRPYVKEWNLQVDGIRKTDQGTYTCVINTSPAVNKLVTLWVWYPPTINEHSPRDIPVRIGDDVILTCSATGFPEPDVKWYKYDFKGQKIELATGRETWEIRNISRDDGGTYECVADNNVSPADKRSMKVDIKYAPEIKLPYQRVSQQPGRDTLLECMITANPVTTHYWQKAGHTLADSTKYRIHTWDVAEYTRTLGAFVYDLASDDFGAYTCVAENEFGRAEQTMHVYEWQLGEVRVLTTPADAASRRGQSALFNCTVEGLSHKDALTWWHVTSSGVRRRLFVSHPSNIGHHITYLDLNRYEIQGHYNLYIKNVSHLDAGTYICEISGQRNHTATLTVVDWARCDVNSSVVEEGKLVHLTCSLQYSGPGVPHWEVEWQHADRRLSVVNDDSPGLVHRFISFPAFKRDTGTYVCRISSPFPAYKDQCTTSLSVKPPDLPPDTVCKDTSTMITTNVAMVILAAGVGGLLILFICILTAVVLNFKRQIRKFSAQNKANESHGQRSAVRYKNGSINMETDALTRDHDHTEVDV